MGSNIWILLNLLYLSRAQMITVYEKDFLDYPKSKQANISISECSNFPEELVQNASSVNTQDNCARLYNEPDCRGQYIEMSPRAPSHNRLKHWNFSGKAVLAGPCPDTCSTPLRRKPSEEIVVTIFNRTKFRGSNETTNVKGCTPIPEGFVNWTKSMQTNGHCVQFYSNKNCRLDSAGLNAIELLPGTPFHEDLTIWGLPVAKRISHCRYKCPSAVKGEVYVFPLRHYIGGSLTLNISGEECISLPYNRIGLTKSIVLGDKICITFFDLADCTGNEFNLRYSTPEVFIPNFDGPPKSLKSCTVKTKLFILDKTSTISPNVRITTKDDEHNIVSTNISFLATTKRIFTKQNVSNGYSGLPSTLIAVVVVVPLASILVSVLIVIFVMRKWHSYKNVVNSLSEKEIQEFLGGFGIDASAVGGLSNSNEYSTELLAQNRPYNSEYEIARARIEIDSDVILGRGEFGTVYKGKIDRVNENAAESSNARQTVAIKTVHSCAGLHGLRSLLKEVKVMLYVGQHKNIAQIIGCCTENLRQGEILVLMEFCSGGSLESFLSKNRVTFKNFVKNGRVDLKDLSNDATNLDNGTASQIIMQSNGFDIFQILKWCIDVASGMEFLSKAKVIHSDLAARNILLDDSLQAKISDFGLSRQLYTYSEYMKKQQEPLPWRWMALESLKCLEFSTKSDVWSYGVLCWEIFTLGRKPYPGLGWNEAFIFSLENGLKLSQPEYASDDFYNIMYRCWETDPALRPSFTDILDLFSGIRKFYESLEYVPKTNM